MNSLCSWEREPSLSLVPKGGVEDILQDYMLLTVQIL